MKVNCFIERHYRILVGYIEIFLKNNFYEKMLKKGFKETIYTFSDFFQPHNCKKLNLFSEETNN